MARKPRVSYREDLVAAIQVVFPAKFFRQFAGPHDKWTPRKVFWMSVVMSWQPQAPLGEQFEFARAVLKQAFPRWTFPKSLSRFLDVRACLLPKMRDPIERQMRDVAALRLDDCRVCGWLLMGVDGSRFEAPRTAANEKALGCAGKESTTPQVFQTTILHLGTGLPWDFRTGPGIASERRHLDDMLASLPPRSLLTADAGFISFDLCRWLCEHSFTFLLRVGGNVKLLSELGYAVEVEGQTVYLWPQKRRHLPPIVLRLIVLRPEGRKPIYLVTNVLDETRMSDADAAKIYAHRWELELHYRTTKKTFDRDHLQSRTPHKALTEQQWNMYGAWLLQLLCAQALWAAKKPSANWSAALARRAVRRQLLGVLNNERLTPQQSLRQRLSRAQRDAYHRAGPKETRHWPRKKEEQPPKPPIIQPATPAQRKKAQQLTAASRPKI